MPSESTSRKEDQLRQTNQIRRTGNDRLIWEKPLGVIRGPLDEPGPRFVDVEGEADRAACVWERGEKR